MQDKKNKLSFDPEKISLVDFKMVKGQLDIPEDFEVEQVEGHQFNNSLELGTNLNKKLVKADFIIELQSMSAGKNQREAQGHFHLVFIYSMEHLEEWAKLDSNTNLVALDPNLAITITSITYSTARGVLLTRLQGTALQRFMLPVVDPVKLLKKS